MTKRPAKNGFSEIRFHALRRMQGTAQPVRPGGFVQIIAGAYAGQVASVADVAAGIVWVRIPGELEPVALPAAFVARAASGQIPTPL